MRKDLVSKIAADMASLPRSKQEAEAKAIDHYYTGKPCKHGHLAVRNAKTGNCAECCVQWNLKYKDRDNAAYKKPCPTLLKVDDVLADKALARELKEVWDE